MTGIGLGCLWLFGSHTIVESAIVPFEKVNVDNPNMDIGKSNVSTQGVPGTKDVTFRVSNFDGSKTEESERISTPPVTETTSIGTNTSNILGPYQPPALLHGSVCNDGSTTPSQGSGTCSWHHGVNYTF